MQPLRYDEMRPGSWDLEARLRDMATCGVVGSLCFPSLWVGFCGATSYETRTARGMERLAPRKAGPSAGIPHHPRSPPPIANAERGFVAVSFTENPTGRLLSPGPFPAREEEGALLFLPGGRKKQVSKPAGLPIQVNQNSSPSPAWGRRPPGIGWG